MDLRDIYVMHGVAALFVAIGAISVLWPVEIIDNFAPQQAKPYRDDPRMLGVVKMIGWSWLMVFLLIALRIRFD